MVHKKGVVVRHDQREEQEARAQSKTVLACFFLFKWGGGGKKRYATPVRQRPPH